MKLEESKKETLEIKKTYDKWLSKKKRELEKALKKLEKAKPPKKVDENLLKIVETNRKAYVSAFLRDLSRIKTIEDLGENLSPLSKIHVSYGRHVMILFEKEVHAINSILKELDEGYREYLRELAKRSLPEVTIERKLEELRRIEEKLNSIESQIEELKNRRAKLREELRREHEREEVREVEEKINRLKSEKRKLEIKIRSNVSRTQKTLKRLRLGGIYDQLARDSGVAIENPKEVVNVLRSILPKMGGKARKSAEWLVDNLEHSVEVISGMEREIEELERAKRDMLSKTEEIEREIQKVEEKIRELESEKKKMKRMEERIKRDIIEEKRLLENVLGERIEL